MAGPVSVAAAPGIFRYALSDSLFAAFSSRQFPKSRYPEFLRALDLDSARLRRPKQEHTGNVLVLPETAGEPDLTQPADGLMTLRTDVVLGILTADCLPVFFWTAGRQPLRALVHAGWRGLHQQILTETLKRAAGLQCPAGHLQVFFGPAIRGCCYRVGAEFRDYFPAHFRAEQEGNGGFVDLPSVAKDQLMEAGVRPDSIQDSGFCTCCRGDVFFSVRHEPATPERILSVLAFKEEGTGTRGANSL